MFGFKKLLSIPSRDDALPGRPAPVPTAAKHFINGNPLKGPYPAGLEPRCSAWAASGAPSASSGSLATHLRDRGRLCGRPYAQSDLRGGLLRPDRPQRGRAGGLRPEEGPVREASQDVLGEPRPDPGHAPGQRRRHAVPLRHLHYDAGAEAGRRGIKRCSSARSSKRYGAITTEIFDAPHSISPRMSSAVPGEESRGYCGLGGTGVSFRSAPALPSPRALSVERDMCCQNSCILRPALLLSLRIEQHQQKEHHQVNRTLQHVGALAAEGQH